jgi:hypothetical protein
VPRPSGRPVWFAWWYVCIAVGFLLLAIRQLLVDDWTVGVIVRIVIALGFALLAFAEIRRNVG